MKLAIVVVIIGILAAIGIATFANSGDDAKDTTCKSNMKAIATVIQMYKTDNNTDPARPTRRL